MPNMEIFSPSDSSSVEKIVKSLIKTNSPAYVRLDREMCSQIYNKSNFDLTNGFSELLKGNRYCIISTGKMSSVALNISKEIKEQKLGVIDIYKIKPLSERIFHKIKKYKKIF